MSLADSLNPGKTLGAGHKKARAWAQAMIQG